VSPSSATASPPPPPPPPPITVPTITTTTIVPQKSSIRADISEQRQYHQDSSRPTDSVKDQQWHMVISNRGLRKATTAIPHRRETTEESQITNKSNKIISNNHGKNIYNLIIVICVMQSFVFHYSFVRIYINIIICLVHPFFLFVAVCFVSASFIENPMASSSSHTHTSVSKQMTQSRRRGRRRLTRPTSPPNVPISAQRQTVQTNPPLYVHNREVAFRQLTEQLWAAGLPSSTTACSMSVRSRCSSAPPSERGGADDEMAKIDWNDNHGDEDENMIAWDEPDKPDEGNSSRKKSTMPIFILYYFHINTHTCLLLTRILIVHALLAQSHNKK
jgi:hypothetical protein